ncbi:hypothetical protein Tco_1106572 [Tanacetum coccineum]
MDITLTLSPITSLDVQFDTLSPSPPIFGHPIPWNLLEAHGDSCLCCIHNRTLIFRLRDKLQYMFSYIEHMLSQPSPPNSPPPPWTEVCLGLLKDDLLVEGRKVQQEFGAMVASGTIHATEATTLATKKVTVHKIGHAVMKYVMHRFWYVSIYYFEFHQYDIQVSIDRIALICFKASKLGLSV